MKRLRVMSVAAATALLLTGAIVAPGTSSAADDPVPVDVAMHWTVPQPSWISMLVAQEDGLFEGVEPTFNYLGSTALAIQAVVAGNASIGIAAPAAVLQAIRGGADITIVANHIQNDPAGVIVRGKADSWSDLEGKTVATTETTAERPLFNAMLKSQGLEDKVTVQNVDSASRCTIVITGTVDACTGWSYADFATVQIKGVDASFLPFSTDETPYPGPVIFVRNDYLADHGDVVTAFLAGTVEGALAAEADTDAAVALMKRLDVDAAPGIPEKAVPIVLGLQHSERSKEHGFGYMTNDAFQRLADALEAGGVLEPGLDVSKAYTNDYLPANATKWR